MGGQEMASKMCPLLTVKQSNPILCRHDCAWYVAVKPESDFEESREGCALNMLAQELYVAGAAVTEGFQKLQQTAPARA